MERMELQKNYFSATHSVKLANLKANGYQLLIIDRCVLIPVFRPWAPHLKENRANWGKELEQLEKENGGKGKELESEEHSKINEDTDAPGKVTQSTKSTSEAEEDGKESVRIELDDRLSDDLESIDFIDRDGEDEKEVSA
ncbi:unnamed protein product [Rodentolepis nana]|uniref:PDEase domain-containing protein n=1 Tax=Rodentolepis nana TaxID=102285 RepID=A0A0R3TA53_RODNA|nr:unnamed protein product [Rodentolepis nana]